jgi:hypothetical protein
VVLRRGVEIAEPAVTVADVEVQRGQEGRRAAVDAGPGDPFIGQQIRSCQRAQIPAQFFADVVLDVGHRVRNGAPVQGIAVIPADVLPQGGEQRAGCCPLTSLAEPDALADPRHRLVRCGHRHLRFARSLW